MSNALRRVTVERGIDARSCALNAFGGAARCMPSSGKAARHPQGDCAGHSSALSALGVRIFRHQYTLHRSIYLSSVNWDKVNLDRTRADIIAEISRLLGSIDEAPEFRWIAAVAIRQSYAVELPQPDLDSPSDLGDAFANVTRSSTVCHRRAVGSGRAAVDSDGAEADSARRRAWCRCDGGRLREAPQGCGSAILWAVRLRIRLKMSGPASRRGVPSPALHSFPTACRRRCCRRTAVQRFWIGASRRRYRARLRAQSIRLPSKSCGMR